MLVSCNRQMRTIQLIDSTVSFQNHLQIFLERGKGRNKGGEVTKSNVRRKYSQGKAYIIGKVSKSSQTVILHADGIHCKRSIQQINREVLNAHFLIVCYNLET